MAFGGWWWPGLLGLVGCLIFFLCDYVLMFGFGACLCFAVLFVLWNGEVGACVWAWTVCIGWIGVAISAASCCFVIWVFATMRFLYLIVCGPFFSASSTRWGCHCVDCHDPRVGGMFQVPVSLDGYCPSGYCLKHVAMITADLAGVSAGRAADKIQAHVSSVMPDALLFVRHWRRDLFAGTYASRLETGRRNRGDRYRWLMHLVSLEDPDAYYLEHYLLDPARYIFVPKGAHHAVNFIMKVVKRVDWYLNSMGYLTVNFIDENVLGIGGMTSSGWRDIPVSRVWQLLTEGARILESSQLFCFSTSCRLKWRGVTLTDHDVQNFATRGDFVFEYSIVQKLCFGGFFGLHIALSRANLQSRIGAGGIDDIERSVRAILYFGSVVVFHMLVTRKTFNQRGGLVSQYGSVANRMRMRYVECGLLLLWAVSRATTRERQARVNRIIAWWKSSEMLRPALVPLRPQLLRVAWVLNV